MYCCLYIYLSSIILGETNHHKPHIPLTLHETLISEHHFISVLDRVKTFEFDDGDILVATYPKSGEYSRFNLLQKENSIESKEITIYSDATEICIKL